MEEASNFVKQAVIVIILSAVLTLGLMAWKLGYTANSDLTKQVEQIFNENRGPSFVKYDGSAVDGAYVRKVIEEFGGEWFIRLRTVNYPLTFGVYSKPIRNQILWEEDFNKTKSLVESSSECYVKSNALFDTTVLWDENNDLLGVYFEQQGITNSAPAELKMHRLSNSSAPSLAAARASANSLRTSVNNLLAQVERDRGQYHVGNDNSSRVLLNSYNLSYQNYVKNKKLADDAWGVLMNKCEEKYGTVYGHVEIDSKSGGDSNSLDYWIEKQNEAEGD